MDGQQVTEARIVLGAVASMPVIASQAAGMITGNTLTDEVIQQAAEAAGKSARPVKNADYTPPWRRNFVSRLVGYALREIRGDDMSAQRRSIAHHELV